MKIRMRKFKRWSHACQKKKDGGLKPTQHQPTTKNKESSPLTPSTSGLSFKQILSNNNLPSNMFQAK